MWLGLENLFSNIGVSFESTLLFIAVVGNLIIMAKDFKIGFIFLFVISGGLFMWFYNIGFNYVPSLVVMLMSLVILSFTLYPVTKTGEAGGFV